MRAGEGDALRVIAPEVLQATAEYLRDQCDLPDASAINMATSLFEELHHKFPQAIGSSAVVLTYIIVWHTGDSPQAHTTLKEAMEALRYFPDKSATVHTIDTRTAEKVSSFDLRPADISRATLAEKLRP